VLVFGPHNAVNRRAECKTRQTLLAWY
jgi:hypothetical protein